MKRFDFSTGAAKIQLALDRLQQAWGEVRDDWDDEVSRKFAEKYLDPIPPNLKTALDAIGRLALKVDQGSRDCDEETKSI